jgi:hypothetical protein
MKPRSTDFLRRQLASKVGTRSKETRALSSSESKRTTEGLTVYANAYCHSSPSLIRSFRHESQTVAVDSGR